MAARSEDGATTRRSGIDALGGWRPAAQNIVADLEESVGGGPWLLVPRDGSETISSTADAPAASEAQGHFEVPLALPDGTLFATLRATGLTSDHGERALDRDRVESSAAVLSSLLAAYHEAARAQQRAEAAESLALTDPLTGLLNLRGWHHELDIEESRSTRSGSAPVVAVIDLDGLKRVNDSQGHLAGDVLLRLAGETLQRAVRAHDVVARLGGDEFGVLAVDYAEPRPRALRDRLVDRLQVNGIDASVGAVLVEPGEPLLQAVHRADTEMYAAKRARRSPRAD